MNKKIGKTHIEFYRLLLTGNICQLIRTKKFIVFFQIIEV